MNLNNSLEKNVVSGIVSSEGNTQALGPILAQNIEDFVRLKVLDKVREPSVKTLASLVISFFKDTGTHITKEELRHTLAIREDIGERESIEVLALYENLSIRPKEMGRFSWWVDQLQETHKAMELANILEMGAKILGSEVRSDQGITYKGATDALYYLQEKIEEAIYSNTESESDGGDIRNDLAEIIKEKEDLESGKMVGKIPSGIFTIDNFTQGGFSYGWLIILGAYAKQGKSQVCVNIAYNYYMRGYNVVCVTTEMTRKEYRDRLLTRHSREDSRTGGKGIPHMRVSPAKWESPEEKQVFLDTATDLCLNESYGHLDLKMGSGLTLTDIKAYTKSYERRFGKPADILVLDYLSMLKPSVKRANSREELVIMFKELKSFAMQYNNGRGLIILTPHQLKQEDYAKCKPEHGRMYKMTAFSETSEAAKSVDLAITMFQDDTLKAQKEIAMNFVAYRHGPYSEDEVFRVPEDFETCFVGD